MTTLKDKMHKLIVPAKDCGELTEKTIFIGRNAKVVKGGRRFGFRAIVIVGDGMGHVGYGSGKASEVPDAIRKASEAAKKAIIKVPMRGSTIPHDFVSIFGPTTIVLKPAKPGAGVVAGSVVRAVCEIAGIEDISTKCIGSNNANNILRSLFNGILSLKDPEEISGMRGMSIEQMEYAPY